ncbi:DUF3575 domain-containing protein [Dokdonia sinensis]|uniref:DUF3575 domain-containing protein n=1 Tax=Dokdonia sinensis TaxID=2479847 RepID=A0A3M0G444_9FLAO|nr:DUF3575 domain-containing protein [Dokdonia sinensis]RMB56962.1 DUF3575 domain-containing protein [Dokdonia sinensis]
MHKKSIILLVLILLTPIFMELQAQTPKELRIELREARRARKDSLQSLPVNDYISLNLVSLLPTDTPRINIGYVKSLNEKFAVGASVGIGTNALTYPYKEDYFLWEIRPEFIYNLGKRGRFQHFLGLETFYISNRETLRNSRFEPVNDQGGTIELIRYDRADFERTKYGAVINYGEYINFSSRLALRTTIGAGIRFKDNSFTNVVNPRIDQFDTDGFIISGYDREGSRLGFELNLDFQLIYKFN